MGVPADFIDVTEEEVGTPMKRQSVQSSQDSSEGPIIREEATPSVKHTIVQLEAFHEAKEIEKLRATEGQLSPNGGHNGGQNGGKGHVEGQEDVVNNQNGEVTVDVDVEGEEKKGKKE